jgi:hypothetical protein
MFKTVKSVGILQAVAAIAGLAVLFWSLGLPSLRFAEAVNLTEVSDTLSDSASSTPSNHTISFVIPNDGSGVAAGETVVVTFPTGDFDFTNITVNDIDFASSTDYALAESPSGETWGVATSTSPDTITFTSGSATLAPGATVTIEIGTNATFGATGVNRIVNPSSNGTYKVNLNAGPTDAGETIVVILDTVHVTASVDTTFTFTVAGLGGGETVNGTTTTGTTTATSIPFGLMQAGAANATTTAQRLSVETNASNGYTVSLQIDHTLLSSTGADIDLFNNGTESDVPAAWANPSATIGNDNTYGHWGVTSEDSSTFSRANEFGSDEWIAASTTPRVVMGNDGPANGVDAGTSQTDVGFKIEISALQEAGDDYSAVLTYVATPSF